MAEHDTLLAHLVPKLTSQVENAATDALAFILNTSTACRDALDWLLRDGDFNPGSIVRVDTQVTYEDGSRPDMVGYDQSGAKRLLVEAKFWASLQQDQANRYFELLKEDGPGVLLFIAPDSRIETLRAEIGRQMQIKAGLQLEPLETDGRTRKALLEGSDKRLMLISWDQLLGGLAVAAADDYQLASDIQQLIGLAKCQDKEAFYPIHPEEFGLVLPRRIRGLHRLIDAVVDAGVDEGWMRANNRTPRREGYGRYFKFIDVSSRTPIPGDLFLCVHYRRWATNADTPLWLRIYNEVPINLEILRQNVPSLVEEGFGCDVPIYLETRTEYDRVLDEVVSQVKVIRDMIVEP